jgi:ribosomal protein S18 acetylase RimI-like enzyme
MSANLTLARPEDLEKVVSLVERFHEEMKIDQTADRRRESLVPLLAGSPHGAVYLIGPRAAALGYIVVTFGWSIEFGGLDAILDELYIRPNIRGRGIASEALLALSKALGSAGVKALHLEVDREDDSTRRLYTRAKFEERDRYMLMSRVLS